MLQYTWHHYVKCIVMQTIQPVVLQVEVMHYNSFNIIMSSVL